MTLSQLRYFQAVCNFDSISKASKYLHVSQPTVSIAVGNLEEEFGVTLFLRENRHLELTEAGGFFLERVNQLLADSDLLCEQMSHYRSNRIDLRVSMVPVGLTGLFPKFLERFRETYPDIQITISEFSAQKAVTEIKNGRIDLAVTVAFPEKPDFIEGIVLYQTPCVFCVGKTHPLSSWEKCSFSDLIHHSFLLSNIDSYLTQEIQARFRQLGVTPKVSLYSVQSSLIREILTSGRDGAILTDRVAKKIPDIIRIPIEDSIEIAHAVIWKKASSLSPGIKSFVKLMKEFYPDAIVYQSFSQSRG